MGRVDAINAGMAGVSPLSSVEIPSLQDKVPEAEWKVRVDLAAAYRLVAHYGWDDPSSPICRRGCLARNTTSCSTRTTSCSRR